MEQQLVYETNDLKLQSKIDKFLEELGQLEEKYGLVISHDYSEDYNVKYDSEYGVIVNATSHLVVLDEDLMTVASIYDV